MRRLWVGCMFAALACGGGPGDHGDGVQPDGPGPALSSPWPMAGAGPTHAARTTADGPASEPLLERHLAAGRVDAVVIDSTGLAIVGIDGSIVAMNRQGSVAWSRQGATRPALASDGTIYVGGMNGLAALDSAGNEKWMRSGSYRTPTITALGTILTIAGPDVVALRGDGSLAWTSRLDPVGELATSSPDGRSLYVTTVHGIVALDEHGVSKWTLDLGSEVTPPAAVSGDGTIFVALRTTVAALHPDGTLAWRSSLNDGDLTRGGIAIGPEGDVYVGGCATMLYAFAPDGQRRWSYNVRPIDCETIVNRAIFVDRKGLVFVGGSSGVRALSPFGALLWQSSANVGSVSVLVPDADGRLYVGGQSLALLE